MNIKYTHWNSLHTNIICICSAEKGCSWTDTTDSLPAPRLEQLSSPDGIPTDTDSKGLGPYCMALKRAYPSLKSTFFPRSDIKRQNFEYKS